MSEMTRMIVLPQAADRTEPIMGLMVGCDTSVY